MRDPGWATVRAREVVNDFIDSAAPRLNAAEMVMLVERVAAALESLRREMSHAPTQPGGILKITDVKLHRPGSFRDIELRVAANNALTPEQARELYAAYVKRGLESDGAKSALQYLCCAVLSLKLRVTDSIPLTASDFRPVELALDRAAAILEPSAGDVYRTKV